MQLLNYLWDRGQRPPRTIPQAMRKLHLYCLAKDKRAFSQTTFVQKRDLAVLKGKARYEIEKDKEANTIFLVKL